MSSQDVGGTGTTLLLIDVQNSFHPGGSLGIPGADEDAARIADLVQRSISSSSIDRIVATLDSHHKLHIAHPSFWVDGNDGKIHPDPFTIITSEEVKSGKWKPRPNLKLPVSQSLISDDIFEGSSDVFDANGTLEMQKYCEEYTRLLESKGRFKLCIWPEHCLIGSQGHCMVQVVQDSIENWIEATGGSVEWVQKGQNLLTESYSALAAEVPLTTNTSFDSDLFNSLLKADRLLIGGQALSHCVNYTVRDIVDKWPESERHKICVLTDCARAVPGFESSGEAFLEEMKAAGVTLCESIDVL